MENNIIYPNDLLNRKRRLKKNTCFIIMPFGSKTDEVYATIKRAVASCNMDCDRSDEMKKSLPFINKIISSINSSYFLIVDISGLNPNVFYELGIAHTLRSINRVLILKDSKTDCPSDIKHLNYFNYTIGKYSELYDHVVNFIKNNNSLDDLGDLFLLFNLIQEDDDLEEIVSDVKKNLADNSLALVNIMNNNLNELSDEDVQLLLKNIYNRIFSFTEAEKYCLKQFYLNLLLHLLPRLIKNFDISDSISIYYKNNIVEKDKYLLEVQSNIAASLMQLKNYSVIFEWVKNYLMISFPASVDITKYKLQIALLNSRLPETAEFLVDNLKNNYKKLNKKPNRSLVEHSLNLCREKEIAKAIPFALKYIESTSDEFIFRSAVDLIVQVGTANDILTLLETAKLRNDFIMQSSFLKDHIDNAQNKLKKLNAN